MTWGIPMYAIDNVVRFKHKGSDPRRYKLRCPENSNHTRCITAGHKQGNYDLINNKDDLFKCKRVSLAHKNARFDIPCLPKTALLADEIAWGQSMAWVVAYLAAPEDTFLK